MQAIKNIGSFAILFALVLALTGCGEDSFNYGKVGNLIEGRPMHLDAEYVILTTQQLDCGVAEDLWLPQSRPILVNGQTATSTLTQKGRDLKFSDDVMIGEKRYPYVQIRGDFNMKSIDISSDRAGPQQQTRLVEVKLGVIIPHSCFTQPLPVMGVRKGEFTQDYLPVLLFRYDNGWSIDRIVHN